MLPGDPNPEVALVDAPVAGQVQVEILRIGRPVAARRWTAHSHARHAHSGRGIRGFTVGEAWRTERFFRIGREAVYVIAQVQNQVDAPLAARPLIVDQPLVHAVFVGRPALAGHERDAHGPPGVRRRCCPGAAQTAGGAVGGDEPIVVGGIGFQVADEDAHGVVRVRRRAQHLFQHQFTEFRGAADLDHDFGTGFAFQRLDPAPQKHGVRLRVGRRHALGKGVAVRRGRSHRLGEAAPGGRQHKQAGQRAGRVLEEVSSLSGHRMRSVRRFARRAGRGIGVARRRG